MRVGVGHAAAVRQVSLGALKRSVAAGPKYGRCYNWRAPPLAWDGRPARYVWARAASGEGQASIDIRPVGLVHESEHILAVNKPPGMSFHNDQPDELGLVQTLRAMQSRGQMEYRGDIRSVHRLDRVTSGIVLFAKSEEAARCLSQAFQERRIQKYYVAISAKKPKKSQGRISGDMERSRRGSWKMLRSVDNPATTHFRSWGLTGGPVAGLRFFVLKPVTGKTHQLRVAMKALGSPILGDPTYGSSQEASSQDRCYLHAAALRIPRGVFPASDGGALEPEGVDIVLAPTVGEVFGGPGFVGLFQDKVLDAIDSESGCWFPDTKVLSSTGT